MELLTLFRMDIRKKRGTIVCMIILSMLIVLLCSVTFSINDGFKSGMSEAIEFCNGADVIAFAYEDKLTDTFLEQVSADENTAYYSVTGMLEGIDNPTMNGKRYGNDTYYTKQSDYEGHYRLYNSSLSGFEPEIPRLEDNELYMPIGLKGFFSCEIGDTLSDCFGADIYTDENGDSFISFVAQEDFIVRGFFETPDSGSSVIGLKEIVISDSAYDRLYDLCCKGTEVVREKRVTSNPEYNFCLKKLALYKTGSSSLTDKQYLKMLTERYGINNTSVFSITRSEYENYSGLYVNIFYGVCLGFSLILLVIVLIVMFNNISSDIENDYAELGVMKAIGFSNNKLRVRMGLVYIFSELIGSVTGLVLSVFISKIFAKAMITNTGVLSSHYFESGKCLLLIPGIILISIIAIILRTTSLKRVTPVKAVNGNKKDVYFDNRGTVPITKKAFSFKVALRTITSEPSRFIGISIITIILCFAMMIAAGSVNLLKDENVILSMGLNFSEIQFNTYNNREPLDSDKEQELFEVIKEYTDITHFYDYGRDSLLINGDSVLAIYYIHPEEMTGIVRGRAPVYDNEFITTQTICDEYGLSIGDMVELEYQGKKDTFLLSGINQNMNDAGMNISISLEGMKKLNPDAVVRYIGFDLADETKAEVIIARLNELYEKDLGKASLSGDTAELTDIFSTASILVRSVIFTFSIIFVFVTIKLLVTKAFLRERRDLGIYKALGFTTNRLRLIFALRFTVVSFMGAVIGIVLGILFSGNLMGFILSSVGISYLPLNLGLSEILLVLAVCLATIFASGYLTSGKIRKVEVRELIIE